MRFSAFNEASNFLPLAAGKMSQRENRTDGEASCVINFHGARRGSANGNPYARIRGFPFTSEARTVAASTFDA